MRSNLEQINEIETIRQLTRSEIEIVSNGYSIQNKDLNGTKLKQLVNAGFKLVETNDDSFIFQNTEKAFICLTLA